MRVVVAGYTGLIGEHLVLDLIEDASVSEIFLLGRKEPLIQNSKVKWVKSNLHAIMPFPQKIDWVYCCLGTTKKKAGSHAGVYYVDHDLVLNVAQIAKVKDAGFSVVSAYGANPKSGFPYMKTKGLMETDVKKLDLKVLQIFQPSLLLGKRREFRLGEKTGEILFKFFGLVMFGKYGNNKPILASKVAKAMWKMSMTSKESATFITKQIKQIAK